MQEIMPFSYIDLLRVNMPQIHLQDCRNNNNFCSMVASKCRRTSYYIIYITWLDSVEADMAEEKGARKYAFFLY